MKEYGYIYFMTNDYNTTFYVGVTSDIKRRIFEHKTKLIDGFTKKYNLTKFLYYEKYNSIIDAIEREKQLKNFKRTWKIDLIKQSNPLFLDLYDWLNGNDLKLKVMTKIINNKGIMYEIPYYVMPNKVWHDVIRHCGLDPQSHFCDDYSMSKQIKIQCPAKINLTLKVTGKRPDGFHNIESIMQTISLYDYLTINAKPAEKTEIILSGNSTEIPYNEKNLVYKAVELFPTPSPHRIEIYIEKNIPVSAGLAGGSTDCAGTLFGLNELFGCPLSKEQLHELCAKLGSDLNFCFEGGRQMTSGRGEILEPMEFEDFNVSLIKPKSLGISAKEAYTKFSTKQGNSNFANDLEWAVIDDYPELQAIKNLYPKSMMSGSGSTYFIINDEFKQLDGYEIFNNLKAISYGVTIKRPS